MRRHKSDAYRGNRFGVRLVEGISLVVLVRELFQSTTLGYI
jgi:hypothetical protein